MKHYLFRKASVVHAIKCNKSQNMETSIFSSDKLRILLDKIKDNQDDSKLEELNEEINTWAGQSPVAKESEIAKLIRR